MNLFKFKPLQLLACFLLLFFFARASQAEDYRTVAHDISKISYQDGTAAGLWVTTTTMTLAGGAALLLFPPLGIALFAGEAAISCAVKCYKRHDGEPYYQMARIMEHVKGNGKASSREKNYKEFLKFFNSLESKQAWHNNSDEFKIFLNKMSTDKLLERHPTPALLKTILDLGLVEQHYETAFHHDLTELALAVFTVKNSVPFSKEPTLMFDPLLLRKLDLSLLFHKDLAHNPDFFKAFKHPLRLITYFVRQGLYSEEEVFSKAEVESLENFYKDLLTKAGIELSEQKPEVLKLLDFEMRALEVLSKKMLASSETLFPRTDLPRQPFGHLAAYSRRYNANEFWPEPVSHDAPCPVCLEAITLGYHTCNRCHAAFCAPCLDRHVADIQVCPTCRFPFYTKEGSLSGYTRHLYLAPETLRQLLSQKPLAS